MKCHLWRSNLREKLHSNNASLTNNCDQLHNTR